MRARALHAVAAVLAVSLAAAPAFAQNTSTTTGTTAATRPADRDDRFDRLDRNNDGYLSTSEWPRDARRFDLLDDPGAGLVALLEGGERSGNGRTGPRRVL